ncbi:MAG: alkaline phosphatase family protein [Gemmatimonadales bacterium]|nr:alkaline phosphatase family protein [Gemmatimonadales bacterium]MBP6570589.1 alkaline phosphatase family protein [Gemmatimonadales bacterium]MBP7620046.1 alkaline phosphatase family protein [Gemmatimonadales bacterium]
MRFARPGLAALLVLPASLSAQTAPRKPIRLVIALAVDQLRSDYLDRFSRNFNGGFALLLRDGVFYANGLQDHGVTETAPGHATMMSGRSPASTGIIGNDVGVPDPGSPLLGSTATGASPWRFRGTTLADWMKVKDSATRVLSVSRKDRGAILPVGRMVAPVYWFSQGKFTTSRFYADTLPTWLKAWNARDPVKALAGTSWELGRPASTYAEADDRPFEFGGKNTTFPHPIPADWTMASGELENSSVMDSLILDVAMAGTQALGLGRRNGTDFLSISLSTLDAVGHRYGPGSREVHDHVLNLDRWLGQFLDSLSRTVPLDQVVISLTADHGVVEFPEAGAGGRATITAPLTAMTRTVLQRYGIKLGASNESGLVLANVADLRARGVNVDSLSRALATTIRGLPGVRAVYTPRTLAAAPRRDAEAMRWRRLVMPETGWLVIVAVQPGWVWGSGKTSTSHGTTNLDDLRVPILFRIPGVTAARPSETVRTIDIAPTLAAALGVRPTEAIEGIPLPAALGPRHRR